MISRRLAPFCVFFAPFLSHKGVDFSPVTKKSGFIFFKEGIAECELTQGRSFRTGDSPKKRTDSDFFTRSREGREGRRSLHP
jgi:hypothetical protein